VGKGARCGASGGEGGRWLVAWVIPLGSLTVAQIAVRREDADRKSSGPHDRWGCGGNPSIQSGSVQSLRLFFCFADGASNGRSRNLLEKKQIP
jgi:hypothetical protein